LSANVFVQVNFQMCHTIDFEIFFTRRIPLDYA